MATEISRTYDGHFVVSFDDDAIHTTLTDSGNVVDSWLDEIRRVHRRRLNRLVVGIDVEWRPSTSAHDVPPVALLQICVGRRCLVFKILHADYIPESLSDFLADERFTFVGVGIRDDAAKLQSGYGLKVGRKVDLRTLAATTLQKPALRGAGLQTLVFEVMGAKMEKPHHVRVSAWDARKLTYDQLKYACVDAFASFEVGRRLYDGDY
jgi:ribonuclease D